jgi:hypothetical protein
MGILKGTPTAWRHNAEQIASRTEKIENVPIVGIRDITAGSVNTSSKTRRKQ